MPTRYVAVVRAVTPQGEAMAVAMATARLLQLKPNASWWSVEITQVEDEYTLDADEDAFDYWAAS